MIFSNSDFGKLLASWRKAQKLTQTQVADILGLNQPVISAAETGSVIEAQNRMARMFFCQLESFEAGEMKEITSCVKLAKSLGESRKWLRLTKEVVAERICMGIGSVAAAESQYYVAGIIKYMDHALEDLGKMDEEDRAMVISGALLPSFWVIPVDVAIAKGAYRPEKVAAEGSKAAAEKFRKMRARDFDGLED